MRIELVTLDGDGTIWDFESAMLHALDQSARQMAAWGLRIDGREPSVADLVRDREDVAQEHHGEGLTMERLRWLAFERSLARAGVADQADLIPPLYDAFMELRHDGVRLFDDALASLEDLRGNRKLALLTNGNTDPQRLGLDGMFDVILSAQTCGFWKPDPRIFGLALSELALQPGQAVHVGDRQRNDVQGAKAAGLRAVWINRTAARKEPWCDPDVEIRDLSKLAAIVDQLEYGLA